MIYDLIKELIEAIKEEECFKAYQDSLQVFELPEVKSLMYRNVSLKLEENSIVCQKCVHI